MERIYECYTDIICKAAEAGILTEEMKSFYLSEFGNSSDIHQLLDPEIPDVEVASNASREYIDLSHEGLSQKMNTENRAEFDAKHEPILVNGNSSEIISESQDICSNLNILKWQDQDNSAPSSDTESDIMNISKNNSNVIYDTQINNPLSLFRSEPHSKSNKCLDCSIPVYIDVAKKNAIIKPKTCLHQCYEKTCFNGDKRKSRVETHINDERKEHLLQAEKIKRHKFRINSSSLDHKNLNNIVSNNISEGKKKDHDIKVKNNSGHKKTVYDNENNLSTSCSILSEGNIFSRKTVPSKKIQKNHKEDRSQMPCQNLFQENSTKLQHIKIFKRKRREKLQAGDQTSNHILPKFTEVSFGDFVDASKNMPSFKKCSFCGAKQKEGNVSCHEKETKSGSSEANKTKDGKYEQCLNVNIVCKFYSKVDSAEEEENENTSLEVSSDNREKDNETKNGRSGETSENRTSKRKSKNRMSKIFFWN